MSGLVGRAASDFLELDWRAAIDSRDQEAFKLKTPRPHHGLVASGDEFITSSGKIADLRLCLPDMLAVEMEGAAVAQVCFEFGVPYAIVRTISDQADEDANIDFRRFLERVAQRYAFNIVKRLCAGLNSSIFPPYNAKY